MSDVPTRIKNKGEEAFGTLLNNSSVSEIRAQAPLLQGKRSSRRSGAGGGGTWGRGACSGPPLPPSRVCSPPASSGGPPGPTRRGDWRGKDVAP